MFSERNFWRYILFSISMVFYLNIINLPPMESSLTCTVDTCDSEVESGGDSCYCDYNCVVNGDCCDQICNACGYGCNTTVTTVPTVLGSATCENNCGSSQICEDSSTCCGCDSICTYAGDCCSDYSDFCTNSTATPTAVTYTTSCNSSCGDAICNDDDDCCYCDSSCLINDDCCDDYTLLCMNETNVPTTSPTMMPTAFPTLIATALPTLMPTVFPTSMPTLYTSLTETALSPTLYNTETSISPSSSLLTMAPSIEVTNASSPTSRQTTLAPTLGSSFTMAPTSGSSLTMAPSSGSPVTTAPTSGSTVTMAPNSGSNVSMVPSFASTVTMTPSLGSTVTMAPSLVSTVTMAPSSGSSGSTVTTAPTLVSTVTMAPSSGSSGSSVTTAPTSGSNVSMAPSFGSTVTMAPSLGSTVATAPSLASTVTTAPTSGSTVSMAPSYSPSVTMAPTLVSTVTLAPSLVSTVTLAPSLGSHITMAPSSASSLAYEEEFQITFQVLLIGLDEEIFDEEAQESFISVTAALLGVEETQISLVITVYSEETATPTLSDNQRELSGSSGVYVDVVVAEISEEAIATQLAEDLSVAIDDGTYVSNLQEEGLPVTTLEETVPPTVVAIIVATPLPTSAPTITPTTIALISSSSMLNLKILRIIAPVIAAVIFVCVCCWLVYKKFRPGRERILAARGSQRLPQEDPDDHQSCDFNINSDVEEVENPLTASNTRVEEVQYPIIASIKDRSTSSRGYKYKETDIQKPYV